MDPDERRTSEDRTPAGRSAPGTARMVGLIVVGGIAIALAIFLLIGFLEGDTTDDLEERQPNPAETPTSSTSP